MLNSTTDSLNQPSRLRSLTNIGCSKMCSVSSWKWNYHLISHGTAPSTCCLGLPYPKVKSILCPSEYIAEALKQKFICPFTSPAASSFFVIGKKDGGLRLDRLSHLECSNSEVPLPTSSGPILPGTVAGSSDLHEAGPVERLQPHQNT